MNESKHSRLKISAVTTVKSYLWLKEWKENRTSMPYTVAPENSFYNNKTHRNYLSNWLEEVIIQIILSDGWFVKKIDTTGREITTKTGKRIWVKSKSKTKGEPDIESIIDGRVIYWEVKVLKDRMSKEQREFKAFMEKINAKVYVVKTLDDFLDKYEQYSKSIAWSDFER